MACRASEPRDDASLRDGRGRWWWGWLVLLWILRPSEARAEAPKVDGPAPLELSAGPPDDPVRLRLGASVWVRGEIHQQPETTWAVPQRTRVEAQARWRGLSSFVQIQDVRSWGTEPSTTSTPATTGLHQGYLEGANVNPVQTMTQLIKTSRLFEMSTRALQAYKAMDDAAARQVGRTN